MRHDRSPLLGRTQLDAWETDLIRAKATTLAKRGLVPRSDVDDICQELSIAVLLALNRADLDPKKRLGLSYRAVEYATRNIIRWRRAAKRNACCTQSLDTLLAQGGNSFLGTDPRSDLAIVRADLRMDVATILAKLPAGLCQLAYLLQQQTVTETAEQLGVRMASLYPGVRLLRRRFASAGFKRQSPQEPS